VIANMIAGPKSAGRRIVSIPVRNFVRRVRCVSASKRPIRLSLGHPCNLLLDIAFLVQLGGLEPPAS
jgi:hypothetical protein